jgi:hypothetical protein
MEYQKKETSYKLISPGTIGVSQKISTGYEVIENIESVEETSKLVFLTKNNVIPCGQNQY